MPKGQFPRKPRAAVSFAGWCRSATPGDHWWSGRPPFSFQADAQKVGYAVETAVFYAVHPIGPMEAETVALTRVTLIGPVGGVA